MKSKKAKPVAEPVILVKKPVDPPRERWWLWLFGFIAAAFLIYLPSLDGAFLFDDRYLPFNDPNTVNRTIDYWIRVRPLLMLTYWMNYKVSGLATFSYHAVNVLLHGINSFLVFLIARRVLATVGETGPKRIWLATIAAVIFLAHPVQTEAVSYVASRSEGLSVCFAYLVLLFYLKQRESGITWAGVALVLFLFGAAVTTKEHTLAMPAVILLTDLFFSGLAGLKRNSKLYLAFLAGAILGGIFVVQIIRTSPVIGFNLQGLSPAQYLFTQFRSIWTYLRLFVLPFGLNADYDMAVSQSIADPWSLFGLLALVILIGVCWFYRKQWPLAFYGLLVFLLLLAPTSSIVPIRDVIAERRMYLPMIGLALIAVDLLRHLRWREANYMATAAALQVVLGGLALARNQVWTSADAFWTDTAAKSPNKVRPRFQLAYLRYAAGNCAQAADDYAAIARLKQPDYELLLDWGLALDCANRSSEALDKLQQAAKLEPTGHVYATIGMLYGKQGKNDDALAALYKSAVADPNFAMAYVYRGNVYMQMNDPARAVLEYQKALSLDPSIEAAKQGLAFAQQRAPGH